MITFKKNNDSSHAAIGSEKKSKIGVSFNGRQCPGGHNILLGLLD